MSNWGPSSTTQGPIRHTLSKLRRFVAVTITNALPRLVAADKVNGRRAKSSNAEYHLTASQLHLLIRSAASFRDRVLVQVLVETGIRRAEVAALQVEDVRRDDGLLVIRHGKGGKLRVVPIARDLSVDLGVLCASRSGGPLFASEGESRLSLRHINRIVARAGRLAGIQNPNPRQRHISCHLLRHSFARLWKAEGGSIDTLARIMGHASVKTTWDLYGREGIEDVKRNYLKVMARGMASGRKPRKK